MFGRKSSESITDVQSAWKRIQNVVKMTPTMVFSVIGDSNSFVPRPWPRAAFKTALIEAAKSGGDTWVLYSGDEKGVSKAVRDAYDRYGNKEFGTMNETIHKDNKNRHIKLISITDKKTVENGLETVVHFQSESGGICDFLLEFEKFVSEQEVSFFNQTVDFRMPIPIAIIVCEGDIQTIAHAAGALQNKLPVIIMKGSGKAADLILDYLETSKQLRKNAGTFLGIKFERQNFQTQKKYLKIIRGNRDLVGVFDLNSDNPLKLSNIVGETVVRCWSMEKIHHTDKKGADESTGLHDEKLIREKTTARPQVDNLDITGSSIAWKLFRKHSIKPEEKTINKLLQGHKKETRPDILNPKFTSPTSLPLYFYFGYQLLQESDLLEKCGHILLLEALKANRCDYVSVLLDEGVKLKTKDLPDLYEQTVSCKECQFKRDDCLHMQWILKQILETEAQTLCHKYRRAMEKIEEGIQREKYMKKIKELESSVADSAKRLCCKILEYQGIDEKKNSTLNENTDGFSDTSDILLWAIFANRREIAEICWIRGEDHIFSGLVCSVLLKKLSKKARNVDEQSLSKDLAEHAKMFEDPCIKVMDEMYKDNTNHAVEAMDDQAMIWGVQTNPLTIAYESRMYDVLAHTCSRKKMNKRWYNNLAPDLRAFCKSALQKPVQFITAPLIRYAISYMMFFLLLICYSTLVLTYLVSEEGGSFIPIYLVIWTAGDIIEETTSCFGYLGSHSRFHRSYIRRLKRYLNDIWNAIDFLSYALLITAIIFGIIRVYEESPYEPYESVTADRFYALSLLVMYLRFLEVFLIHRKLGPTLIMIKEMLKDLLHFMLIGFFVIAGVGIYYHAMIFRRVRAFWSAEWKEWRIWELLYYPYWQIYSDLNLDYLHGKFNSTTLEPQYDWTVIVVAGGYVLFMNLLFVNLIIAMFSYTFERIQQNSEKLWWYEMYTTVLEYQWRIPSPFNFLFLPYRFTVWYKKKCCSQRKNDFAKKDGGNKKKTNMNANEYRRELQKIIACSIYNKI